MWLQRVGIPTLRGLRLSRLTARLSNRKTPNLRRTPHRERKLTERRLECTEAKRGNLAEGDPKGAQAGARSDRRERCSHIVFRSLFAYAVRHLRSKEFKRLRGTIAHRSRALPSATRFARGIYRLGAFRPAFRGSFGPKRG